MQQTTTKKQKYKSEVDPQIQAAVIELQNQQQDNKSVSDEEFFHKNANALHKVLALMVSKGRKPKNWKEIYFNNLKTCINLKRHQSVIFHFKVAKQFWRLNFQDIEDLLNAVSKTYEKYKKQGGKSSFPSYELNEILIDYNIVRHNDKKFQFIEKAIFLQCQYSVCIPNLSEDFFNHYLTYCKAMEIITIFTYSCQAYLKYLSKKNQHFTYKYCPFRIIYEIIDFFHQHEMVEGLVCYIVNILILLGMLMKMDKYRRALKEFSFKGMSSNMFIQQLFNLVHKIDKNDQYNSIKSFISTIMSSKQDQKQRILKLYDPLQNKLDQGNLTILQSLKYLASLHHFILQLKNNIRKSQIEAMYQTATYNLKIILSVNKTNELLTVLQHIYYDMGKTNFNIFSPDVERSHIIDNIENPHSKQIQKLIKWFGYFELMNQLYQIHNNVRLKELYKTHLQIKLYMLLAIHIRNNSKNSKFNLMHFLTQTFLPYLSKDFPSFSSYFTVLLVLSKLCLSSEFGELANRCICCIVKVLHVGTFCQQSNKYGYLFTNMVKQKSKDQNNQFYLRRNIFAADTVKVLTQDLIQSFGEFQKKDRINYWVHFLRSSLDAVFFFYQDMDQEGIEEIIKQIVKLSKNEKILQQITSVIKEIGLNIVHQSDFIEERRKIQLQNALIFYQTLYMQLKNELQINFKISFIDFCFNLKSDLYNLFNLLDSTSIQHRKFIQNISDRIDEMQIVILDKSAPKYIEDLTHLILQGSIQNLIDVLSITIKSIFYIVYQQKFIVKLSQRKTNQSKTQLLYQFEEELEESICKLVQVKQKCISMLPIFRNIYHRFNDKFQIGNILIKRVDMQWNKHLAAQLNDLMYMAHLSGVDQLKKMLLSIRLSLISQQEMNENVLFLQIAKYIFLNIFSKQQQQQLTQIVRKKIQSQEDQYSMVIKLLLFGQICEKFENRIFKIFYLLKLNGIAYLNTFREITSYFSYFLFIFPHLPSNLQKQKFLIKTTRNTEIMSLNERQYWIKDCWEEGWVLTKLIIIVNKKILQTAINTNQLSKIKSFLKFSLLLCIRSAHISELQLPLTVAMNRQQSVNLMKVVDSLRKLQIQNINQEAYRQIDKMIFSKRFSISLPNDQNKHKATQISRLYSKIDNSFKNCSKIGSLLAEIFCKLAAKQLNLNAYQSFVHKTKLSIFKNNISKQDQKFIVLVGKDRCLNEQIELTQYLSDQTIKLIFISYQKAVVFKDFISQFIDLSLDQDNIQVLSANYHRIIDQVIAKIALTFESYNYTIKKLLQKIPKITIKQKDPLQVMKISDTIMEEYNKCGNKFGQSIRQQLDQLRHSNYPVSLIFPLGKNVYTISFHNKLLVTFTSRYLLQDKIKECSQLIDINDKLVKENINVKLNINKRLGLDRQLGKMCQSIDIGILDIDFLFISKSLLNQYQKIDLNILKFAYNENLDSQKHFNLYMKRFRLHSLSLAAVRAKLKIKGENQNLLLLIHQKYLQFPFQLIKSIRLNKRGIYRLPSIQYLLENQHRPTQYSIKKCKYLVNTQKNLPETEKRFQKIKTKFGQWMGIKGKIPQFIEVQMLLNQQLFLYMGHGTGLQHLKEQQLYSLLPSCPMLVFGCSSAKMIFQSSEPYGCAYTLLMKGCPAYMGCLWVVTDVDIDKVTEEIFINSSSENLSLILDSARKKCSFPYTNGSSTVVYGMPVHLKR